MKFKSIIAAFICSITIISCSKDEIKNQEETINIKSIIDPYYKSGQLETTAEDRMRNAILELTELSKIALLDNDIAEELGSIVKNEFYRDYIVTLEDLLNPNTSLAYQHSNVSGDVKGSFKTFYSQETEDFPNKYLNLEYVLENRNTTVGDDTIDFYELAHIAFYLPYEENDDEIAFDTSTIPTLVPAVIDEDSGLAYNHTGEEWINTVANDEYSTNNYTLIVNPIYDPCSGYGMAPATSIATTYDIPVGCNNIYAGSFGQGSGATTTTPNQYTGNCNDTKPGGSYIRQVFIGKMKSRGKQYDKYISFTGNGGGSEFMLCRADSRDNIDTDSLNNITLNQWNMRTESYWKRKQIRKKNVRNMGIKWDENWACGTNTHEQLFVIYEEDREGDLVIDDEISFDADDATYSLDVDVTIQNRSKDQVINKRTRERVEFFATNLLDNGCGCWDGKFSFSDRCWGIQDCGTELPYTMYHRWVYVGDNTSL